MEEVDQVLLTRFNVPSAGYESLIRASDGWLARRLELFETFCLPSVKHQTEQRFQWLIYLDPESPAWLIERMEALKHTRPFTMRLRTKVDKVDLMADISHVFPYPRAKLLSSNLDNDDGLAVDFTARVRKLAEGERHAIYLSNGLIRRGSEVYLHSDPSNAFCSVLSSWNQPDTCWADWHNQLGRNMQVVHDGGAPAWLQVIHGSNVSNRVRGRRVDPSALRDRFPGLLDDVPAPSGFHLLADSLILRNQRYLREYLRTLSKKTIQDLAGRDGADKIKLWLGSSGIRSR